MHMRQCPKFETCSANLCPLDPDWEKRRHHDDDPVCFFMRESVKHGAKLAFMTSGLDDLWEACERYRDPICEKWPNIRKYVERSRKTTLRLGVRRGVVGERPAAPLPDHHPWKRWRGD